MRLAAGMNTFSSLWKMLVIRRDSGATPPKTSEFADRPLSVVLCATPPAPCHT